MTHSICYFSAAVKMNISNLKKAVEVLGETRTDKWIIVVYFYLASSGLYIPHVSSVGLENNQSSKVHIFTEEL